MALRAEDIERVVDALVLELDTEGLGSTEQLEAALADDLRELADSVEGLLIRAREDSSADLATLRAEFEGECDGVRDTFELLHSVVGGGLQATIDQAQAAVAALLDDGVPEPSWPETAIDVWPPEGERLTIGSGAGLPSALLGRGPMYVVTAYNPLVVLELSEDANERLMERLEHYLAGLGVPSLPAIGRAIALPAHRERSVALFDVPAQAACAIGARFGQRAIWRVDEYAMTAVDCCPALVDDDGSVTLDARWLSDAPESMRQAWDAARRGETVDWAAAGLTVDSGWLDALARSQEEVRVVAPPAG